MTRTTLSRPLNSLSGTLRLLDVPNARESVPLLSPTHDVLIFAGKPPSQVYAADRGSLSPIWDVTAWCASEGFEYSRPVFVHEDLVGVSGVGDETRGSLGRYQGGSTAVFSIDTGEMVREVRNSPIDPCLVQIGDSILGVESRSYYEEQWPGHIHRFVRLAVPNCDLIWQHSFSDQHKLSDQFVCDEQRLIAFDELREMAVCLDFESGQPLWESPLGKACHDYAIWQDRAILGALHLVAYDLNSGRELWRIAEAPSSSISRWLIHEGAAYRVCKRHFESIDLLTGATISCRDIGSELDRLGVDLYGRIMASDPLAGRGDFVYFPCAPHFLAFHRHTGEIVWHGYINQGGFNSARWIDDRLFIWSLSDMTVWEPGEQGPVTGLSKIEQAMISPPRPRKRKPAR